MSGQKRRLRPLYVSPVNGTGPGTTPLPGSDEWERLSDEEKGAVHAAYKALNETPGVTPGQQLSPPETATTVRVRDGRTLITDGPFAEIKEAIGGYFLFEADDLDAAIDVASRVPAAAMGGAVEVRPIVTWQRSSNRSSETSGATSSPR